ncbi:hypothetical protein CS537_18360, partial [Yersinia mollaretii]
MFLDSSNSLSYIIADVAEFGSGESLAVIILMTEQYARYAPSLFFAVNRARELYFRHFLYIYRLMKAMTNKLKYNSFLSKKGVSYYAGNQISCPKKYKLAFYISISFCPRKFRKKPIIFFQIQDIKNNELFGEKLILPLHNG